MPFTPQNEKDLEQLLAFLNDPSEKEVIRSLCAEKPEMISALLDNYQRKVQALKTGDTQAVAQILADEKKLIASIA